MNTSLPQRVAAEIRAELARRRMTQAALASALGKSEMYVSRRLADGTSMDIADLERIADALGVPATHFIETARSAA